MTRFALILAATTSLAVPSVAPANAAVPSAVPAGAALAAESLERPDRAVEAARKALDRWWGYPWYDASQDDVRPVEVEPPWDFDWLDFDIRFSPPGGWLDWLAWLSVAAVLAVLAYWLVQAYRSRRHAETGAAKPDAATDSSAARVASLPYPLEEVPVDFLAEARRYYEAGDFGRAIVYLFGFQLLELDRRQLIRLVRGATNRQYLRQLAARPMLREAFETTMVAFEDVYFGHRPLSRERFEQCWFRLARFDALSGAPS